MHTEIENLVQALQIPNVSDATYTASWYSDAQVTLISLHKLAQSTRDLPPELVVLIAAHVAPFHASAPWTNDTLQQQADGTSSIPLMRPGQMLIATQLCLTLST